MRRFHECLVPLPHQELESTKSQQETAVMAYLNRYVEEMEDSGEFPISASLIQKLQYSQ